MCVFYQGSDFRLFNMMCFRIINSISLASARSKPGRGGGGGDLEVLVSLFLMQAFDDEAAAAEALIWEYFGGNKFQPNGNNLLLRTF